MPCEGAACCALGCELVAYIFFWWDGREAGAHSQRM